MESSPKLYPLAGWQLFPVEKHGKRPLTSNGFKDATSDTAKLDEWWLKHPGCNWGLATGNVSGLFVLDVDGAKGAAAMLAFVEQGLLIPDTLTVTTGREDGGWHLYFSIPSDLAIPCSIGTLAEGLDVKGNGGYVVLPPSIHASGRPYSYVDASAPIASPPAWLIERLTASTTAVVLPHQYRAPVSFSYSEGTSLCKQSAS